MDAEVGAVMEAYYPDQEKIDFDQSAAQVRATGLLGEMPLAVLTAGRDFTEPPQFPPIVPDDLVEQYLQLWVVVAEPFAKVRMELQTELADLSSNSRHIMAEESGHFIQNDQPDLVIDAIRQVVEAARQGRNPP